MIPFSILDLSPVAEGQTPADALGESLTFAQRAENLGFKRFWLAEHHNMPGIASAATAVVIAHVAGGTKTIRVGSGGVMLPNHAPLVIAEQFGTLEALHPGRIDLGLGRAPGTDMATARALRRDMEAGVQNFPNDVVELISLLGPEREDQRIRAVPGAGSNVPVWLLGSSLYSAQLAAMLGLPFAFASHFAPDALMQALQTYRSNFRPSEHLDAPHVMVGAMGALAETDEEAAYLFTSMEQQFVSLRRGTPGRTPPPVESMDDLWTPPEAEAIRHTFRYALVGSKATVATKAADFIARTGADELIVSLPVTDFAKRLRSLELLAEVQEEISRKAA